MSMINQATMLVRGENPSWSQDRRDQKALTRRLDLFFCLCGLGFRCGTVLMLQTLRSALASNTWTKSTLITHTASHTETPGRAKLTGSLWHAGRRG